MNLIIGAPLWLIVCLMLALGAAAFEDAFRFRISNLTCAAVLLGALIAAAVHGFSPSLWQNAAVFAIVLAVGTLAFAAGWVGGGDVKLLASISLWLDLRAAVGLIAAVFIAGGLVAVVYIVVRRAVHAARPSIGRRGQIPYGVAVVAGALFVFGTQLSYPHPTKYVDQVRAMEAAEAADKH
jgi:prepilin peptidase CpaA